MDPDGIQLNLESQSVSSLGAHEDNDDEIELGESKVDGTSKMDSKGKRKRKLTSQVWMFFDKLKEKSMDGKQRCKCKKCDAIFICESKYGTGNLKRHSEICVRKDTVDIG